MIASIAELMILARRSSLASKSSLLSAKRFFRHFSAGSILIDEPAHCAHGQAEEDAAKDARRIERKTVVRNKLEVVDRDSRQHCRQQRGTQLTKPDRNQNGRIEIHMWRDVTEGPKPDHNGKRCDYQQSSYDVTHEQRALAVGRWKRGRDGMLPRRKLPSNATPGGMIVSLEKRRIRGFEPGRNTKFLAEREGFEPPIPVKVWPLSRRLVSTTHAPLRAVVYQNKAS